MVWQWMCQIDHEYNVKIVTILNICWIGGVKVFIGLFDNKSLSIVQQISVMKIDLLIVNVNNYCFNIVSILNLVAAATEYKQPNHQQP